MEKLLNCKPICRLKKKCVRVHKKFENQSSNKFIIKENNGDGRACRITLYMCVRVFSH